MLFSVVQAFDLSVCTDTTPDAAQTCAGNSEQAVHLPCRAAVDAVLVMYEKVICLAYLPSRLTAQSAGKLTFTCKSVPSAAVTANIVILGG